MDHSLIDQVEVELRDGQVQEEKFTEPSRWKRWLFFGCAVIFSLAILVWLLVGIPSFPALLVYCTFLGLFSLSGVSSEQKEAPRSKSGRPVI